MSPSRRLVVSQILEGISSERGEDQVELDGSDELQVNLKTSIASLRSLLSPIHQLPSELLINIFTFVCIPTRIVIDGTPDIFTLISVCGRWRDIILSTPSLWADFRFEATTWLQPYVTNPRKDEGYFSRLVRAVQLLLERSQPAPLNLYFSLFGFDNDATPEMVDLLELAAGTRERWRNVIFTFDEGFLDHPISGQLSYPPPLALESLTLVVFADQRLPREPLSLLKGFESCPSLTSLNLNYFVAQNWGTFNLPWRQITKLRVASVDIPSLVRMLEGTSELKELTLSFILATPAPETDSKPVPVFLPLLEHLTLEHCTGVPSILRHLTLPRLSKLFLPFDQITEQWDDFHFTEFLKRSSCTITHLRIGTSSGPGLELLRLFPKLKSLQIEEGRSIVGMMDITITRMFTEAFLNQLFELVLTSRTSVSTPPPYLPQLTALTLVCLRTAIKVQNLVNAVSRFLISQRSHSTTGSSTDSLQRRTLCLSIRIMLEGARDSGDKAMTPMDLDDLYKLRHISPEFDLRADVFRVREE
ncbi:hypothetical protein AAF712_003350 [Marasmius tenuissimus]|uniref:F-box domain-containing protein n=1 Tax=Marasmius tenuissimus TaxID=585030 RepID=A0ABR3A6T4_9AGAR